MHPDGDDSNGDLAAAPYATLGAAVSQASDGSEIFLMPGVHQLSGTIDLPADKSLTFRGAGDSLTTLKGAGIDTNAFYLSDSGSSKTYAFEGIRIRDCLYGIYTKSGKVHISNCRFYRCGWNGKDASGSEGTLPATQAEAAANWASANLTNGGAARIRNASEVHIHDCMVEECLRGLRPQDCGKVRIRRCKTERTVESGIYLSSGSYSAAQGCVDAVVEYCEVREAQNNGLLVVGGFRSVLRSNYVCTTATTRACSCGPHTR